MKPFFKKIMAKPNSVHEAKSQNLLREYSRCSPSDLFIRFSSGETGLSEEVADRILKKEGENHISFGPKSTTYTRLQEALINPFNGVLFFIGVITFFTDVIFADQPSYTSILILAVLILVSSSLAFIQNERSNFAAEKLSQMISNKADVFRGSFLTEVSVRQLVRGDIIQLAAGDILPADLRFLKTKDVSISQAILTGESNPIEKFADVPPDSQMEVTNLTNIGFMGSNMLSGSATALIIATGNNTYLGSVAKITAVQRPKNSFERGVNAVSSMLIRLTAVMVPLVFLLNGLTKNNWMESLLFAVTIAVGITPEMLPVIMTSTLARGAINLSKQKVIVKNLSAIQTFGEMDILCTDKTGTLTENDIALEKYMNIHGEEDLRTLLFAYLNSSFQTGLKDLMDKAIIARGQEQGLNEILPQYLRVDEIPFDFTRRRMSVILRDDQKKVQLITKGAVEELISISGFAENQKGIQSLTDESRAKAIEIYEKLSAQGLRVIALARKEVELSSQSYKVLDESDMILMGYIAFLDPPKKSAQEAITTLKRNGVRVVVLTGDSEGVAMAVGKKVGIDIRHSFTGKVLDSMTEEELTETISQCDLFSKLTPIQKGQLVALFQSQGHTVGYLGDGVNDAPPLHQADVGISVDSGVDIAKATADIILLEKDLLVLNEGILEGRKTFGNIIKYIKMATSGNFGNMISVVIASIFLPFLPMLPIQILTQNLLCDLSQITLPFDHVDPEYLEKPRKWETQSIKSFLLFIGPVNSFFDILCYGVMWWIIGANTTEFAPLFQCGWFLFGTLSQVLAIQVIRTAKIPFLESQSSWQLYLSSAIVLLSACLIGFTDIANLFDLQRAPDMFIGWLALLIIGYCFATQACKKIYIRHFGGWL